MQYLRSFAAFVLLLSSVAYAQNGAPPHLSLGARDVAADYHLPALKNQPAAAETQVIARARRLGITTASATQAWRQAEDTFARANAAAQAPLAGKTIVFSGAKASDLNKLLDRKDPTNIQVTSAALVLDQPIRIHGSHVTLDLGKAHLSITSKDPYMLRIEDASDIRISGGFFDRGNWGILVARSRFVLLSNIVMEGLSGGGILVSASRDSAVWGNRLRRLGGAPIMLHGATTDTVVADNDISNNLNPSNWRAGIVMTDRNADLASNPDSLLNPDLYGVREDPITDRLNIPHDNVIADNRISYNASSAIYSDGAARTVIVGNHIEGNTKEGICLDNGSLANVVAYNVFQSNGKRWGQTDFQLQREFVFNFGRMPDGTSPAKTPGVSLDNAAYNLVLFNQVDRNFGGGIKFVRTSFYNIVGLNTVTDNNEGRSDRFHFFGIELGAATADVKVRDLDFTPSQGNIIFSNTIRGTHFAGIFFAENSDGNQVFDNSIFGATNWAMESVKRQPNFTLNNFSNEPSRNIDPGLDPALGKISAGHFD